jgi:hypothetical protein
MASRTVRVAALVAALALIASGCSNSANKANKESLTVTPDGGTLAPRQDVSVTVPAGAVTSKATLSVPEVDAVAVDALTKQVGLPNGSSVAWPAGALAAPISMELDQPLAAPVTVAFTVDATAVGDSTPFVATYTAGRWLPVASNWDPATHTVSAVTPHLSLWAPFSWVRDRVVSVVKGVMASLFGQVASTPPTIDCPNTPTGVVLSDSPLNDSIEACVDVGSDADHLAVRVANTRAYPIDVSLPADSTFVADSPGSVFEQLGSKVTGSVTASKIGFLTARVAGSASVTVPPGSSVTLTTQFDGEAYLASVLEILLKVAVVLSGGEEGVAAVASGLDAASCLQRANNEVGNLGAALTREAATKLGDVGASCLAGLAGDTVLGVVLTALSLVVGMGTVLVESGWGLVDTATGGINHRLVVSRAAGTDCSASAAAVVAAHYRQPTSVDGIHCQGDWASADVIDPETGSTDSYTYFQRQGDHWVRKGSLVGYCREELISQGIPPDVLTAIASDIWPCDAPASADPACPAGAQLLPVLAAGRPDVVFESLDNVICNGDWATASWSGSDQVAGPTGGFAAFRRTSGTWAYFYESKSLAPLCGALAGEAPAVVGRMAGCS